MTLCTFNKDVLIFFVFQGRATTSGTRYIMISFVNAAYPCFEREGIPHCRGFIRKKNYEEIIKKYNDIARINEGMPYKIEAQVDGKTIVVDRVE